MLDLMKSQHVLALVCLLIAGGMASGCHTTRSISHSGYNDSRSESGFMPCFDDSDPSFAYRGELSELDVLGINRGAVISDTEIERTLASAKQVRLHPGDSILLIQSGARFPDGPVASELGKHFRVVPFSGVPAAPIIRKGKIEQRNAEGFSKSLRLAAARGGNDIILCYWGILESENANLPTRTLSWIPVVNWVLPDEREHMRIRLKMALVDVRTGDWAMFSPSPVEASRISISPRRNVADQKLVESLKQRAYSTGIQELLRQYSEVSMTDSRQARLQYFTD
ncbi:MAG TPA: aminopeptidase [Verrucomicrobiae bacterium]|nr:aminopeptidase [Verrucomicrobiae bacterium]